MRTRRLLWALVVLAFSLSLAAQEETRPESNLDLRGALELFVVRDHRANVSVTLERSASEDYFLSSSGGRHDQRIKVSRREAQQLDESFSSLFFKLQYDMPADPAGCGVTWSLVLRGEVFGVCEKSEQKHQAITALYGALTKSFKP